MAIKYVYSVPKPLRQDTGLGVREFPYQKMWVGNFRGSQRLMSDFKGLITWIDSEVLGEEGVKMGMIEGIPARA